MLPSATTRDRRSDPAEHLRVLRAFTVWTHRVILPSLLPNEALPPVEDLEDVAMVVRERGLSWFEQGELRREQRGELRGRRLGAADALLCQIAGPACR
jgi:hypothetical protein